MPPPDQRTEVALSRTSTTVQSFVLSIQPARGQASQWRSTKDSCSVGSHPSNDVIIEDPRVSRFHCELRLGPRGLTVRDLDSSNGTVLDGVQVMEAVVRSGSRLTLGGSSIEVTFDGAENTLPTSDREQFGALVGRSPAMRTAFALLERAAPSDITVLLDGETGTGKEEAAAAIHAESKRRDAPFVVIDCSALPATLLESELFGHERGAFTGANTSRAGAFEEAAGGTVFLDEVGELPVELQPKLLRVLEAREFRRLGSNVVRTADVRVIAATNRDLRQEINQGRFRADLYFRLAVMRVTMPPLRKRPEDLPLLSKKILARLGAAPEEIDRICTPDFFARLRGAAWPGNVRELRNHLERCMLFASGLPVDAPSAAEHHADPRRATVDVSVPLAVERRRQTEAFEQEYVRALLQVHGDDVSAAAAAAGVDRAYLYRLIKRHRLRG
ncbi:MAG: sigma 54-interacting transcriptional regulator [Myxococcota bacterium]